MSVQRLFDDVSARLLHQDPDVERSRMFNSDGLRTRANGKFFATVSQERLLVKLPAPRVAELVAAGAGQPFHSGGRLMREWVLLHPADEAACAAYVDEARGFVASNRRS
jgi:TfoX/Sxy family transcriptional regulator of competence genes